jgi:hypothetical protein
MGREKIREILLRTWGEQACQVNNARDWPEALERYMTPNSKRGSFKPYVDAAVVKVGDMLDAGEVITVDDMWVAFSKFDVAHREKFLAALRAEGATT